MTGYNELIAQLSPKQRELLLKRLEAVKQKKNLSIQPQVRTTNIFPLSHSQERMWFIHQLDPEGAAYNMPGAVRLRGPLNLEALQRSLNLVVERHEILRSTFPLRDDGPVQMVHPAHPWEMPLLDLQGLDSAQQMRRVNALLTEQAEAPFDIVHGPLLRSQLIKLGDDDHILFTCLHHIVTDNWSSGVLSQEVTLAYEAFRGGQEPNLPTLPIQYADYALWQRNILTDDYLLKQLDYWRHQLANVAKLDLPLDRPRPAIHTSNGAFIPHPITAEFAGAIKQFSITERVTPYMLLLAAFNVILYRYSGQNDITVGSPIANRTRVEIEPLIGTFVNTLVIRTEVEGSSTFRQLLEQVRVTTLAAFDHQDMQFERLIKELQPERDTSRTPLFQAFFNVLNAPVKLAFPAGLTITPIEVQRNSSQFDLSCSIGLDEFPMIALEYNTDLFNRSTMSRLVDHYLNVLQAVIAEPDQLISAIPLLSEKERHTLLEEWNDTAFDYPAGACIHQLFEQQVRHTPQAIAVACGDESLTYTELNQRANQLAHYLRRQGVGMETFVGLSMERSLDMIVALLGILKAGGTYIPLDPAFPRDRLMLMLEDSAAPILVTQQALVVSDQAPANLAVICIDRDWPAISQQPVHNLPDAPDSANLAYIIYTSGSTGKPKGVQLSHRAAVNFLCTMQQTPGLTAADTLLAITTLSFDISVLEIFLPLITGAKVVVAKAEEAYDGARLAQRIIETGTTVMQATPATWRMLIDSGWQGAKTLKVLCGGEALPVDLADWLVEHTAELWNMYGPTETTVWSTCTQITPETDRITIGRPIGNTQIYILDEHLQPVPIGVTGNLYIGGDGVARGYLHRPELNTERFVADPFQTSPGARMYFTGDQARYLSDGCIEFLGRADFQVKIRGYRIELGEIEAILTRHPGIHQAVVVAHEETPGNKRLVAYLIVASTASPTVDELRQFVRTALPEYMVPSFFVFLDEYPLTPNKKVDRKALPAPTLEASGASRAVVAPQTTTEVQVATVWQQVLGLEAVSRDDNFFDLGGHSLLATQVISRLSQQFATTISLRTLFETPRLLDFADHLDTIVWIQQDNHKASSLEIVGDDLEEIEL